MPLSSTVPRKLMFLKETSEHNLQFLFLFSPDNAFHYGPWNCFGYPVPGQEHWLPFNSWETEARRHWQN